MQLSHEVDHEPELATKVPKTKSGEHSCTKVLCLFREKHMRLGTSHATCLESS